MTGKFIVILPAGRRPENCKVPTLDASKVERAILSINSALDAPDKLRIPKTRAGAIAARKIVTWARRRT